MKDPKDPVFVNTVSNRVIGCAITVHKELGPGLLEGIYQECLGMELGRNGLSFVTEVPLPIYYGGEPITQRLRVDTLVEDCLVLELKAVEMLLPIHRAQLLTYLKLTGYSLGLLINFNVVSLRQGVRRLANNFAEPTAVAQAKVLSSNSSPHDTDHESSE